MKNILQYVDWVYRFLAPPLSYYVASTDGGWVVRYGQVTVQGPYQGESGRIHCQVIADSRNHALARGNA